MNSGRTSFDRLLDVVRDIPVGRVASYGMVSSRVLGTTPRMVGFALSALEEGTDVPWHRVINASGRISLPKEDGAYAEQRARLVAEGIVFSASDGIDLDVYGWF